MLYIIYVVSSLIIFVLVHKTLKYLFAVEKPQTLKTYSQTKTVKKKRIRPEFMFSDYVVIPEYKRKEYEKMLFALNVEMTPEQYVSNYIYKPLIILIPALVVILTFKQYIIGTAIAFYAVMTFFREKDKIYKAMDYRKIRIEEEAPNLIRFFIASIENKIDVKTIFERYSEIAKYLKRDINLTLIDMNTVQADKDIMINALYNFDNRLNVQIIREFVTGLIEVLKGKDQQNYFVLLERELKVLNVKNLERKTKKIQLTARNHLFVLIFDYIFIQIAMIAVFIVDFVKTI